MKRAQAFYRVIGFLAVLLLPSLLWGLAGILGLRKSLDYDTNENRSKHKIAEDVNPGNLTSELELWYNDRVPFRSVFLSINRGIDHVIEFPYDKGIEPLLLKIANRGQNTKTDTAADTVPGDPDTMFITPETISDQDTITIIPAADTAASTAADGQSISEHIHDFQAAEHRDPDYENYGYTLYRCTCGQEKYEIAEKLIDTSYFPYKETNKVIDGRFGWLFYAEELADFTGSNLPSEAQLAEYAGTLQAIYDQCQTKGIEFYSISFPNKSRIYPEYMPSVEKSSVWKLQMLENYLSSATTVPFDYPYEEMIAAKPYQLLYYKLDTHWNFYGAVIGLNALHRMMNLPAVDMYAVQPVPEDHPGDLPKALGEPRTEPSCYLNYKPDISVSLLTPAGNHEYFHSGGYEEYVSNAERNQTLVLVGDSFLFHLMRFLPREFSHVIIINEEMLSSVDPALIRNADILVFEFLERHASSATWKCTDGMRAVLTILCQ